MSWQRRLRRGIGWTLAAKLAALFALWAFFFAPADRVEVSAQGVDQQLGVVPERDAG
jgi:hypothetical protein